MQIASDLIAFRTESEYGTDFEKAADYLLRLLDQIDFKTQTMGSENRPIIVGIKKSSNAGVNIILNGHYDVVPAGDISSWIKDPFNPIIEDGRLYGRGAADMKGGLAVICEVARLLSSADADFPGNIYVTFTPDEEIGSKNGAQLLIESQILPKGENCFGLMPECSSLDTIWHATKGTLWYEIQIWGKQAHSTLPSQGINAFEKMCELVNTKLTPLRVMVESRKSTLEGEFPDSPYSILNIGGHSCGEKSINTIPGVAVFSIDRRIIPEEQLSDVQDEIKELLEDYSVEAGVLMEVKQLLKADPSVVEKQHPLCQALFNCATTIRLREPKFAMCAGHMDTRFFNTYGIPMIAYGVGSLEVAHAPNEFVEIAHLDELAKIYLLTCLELAH